MKAEIREGCIGCGLCESTCPEVFRMGDEGVAEVHGQITANQEELAMEAKDGCPVDVIEIEQEVF